MKPKEVLRTIESHLDLGPCYMPNIKEDRKYLEDIGAAGATIRIKGKKSAIILVENKKDLYVLAEELTHFIDTENAPAEEPTPPNDTENPDKEHENFFYNQALIEALGYYGSKIIAPERKPIHVRKRLKRDIAKKDWGSLRKAHTVNYRLQKAWHEIGYDLGEKVYSYVQRTGRNELATALMIKNRQKEKPFKIYKKILEQVTR